MKPDFTRGLLPVIIVDEYSKEVLMLAYMNEESYNKTLETNETWFFSRSRQSLWNKGETSGHKQQVQSIKMDCDEDTLLIYVKQNGPACHTGEPSCFYKTIKEGIEIDEESVRQKTSIFEKLMDEINDRKSEIYKHSYTNYLFEKGIDKICKKVIEEAGEVVIAAKNQDKDEMIKECADLLYHSFVLLTEKNITLKEVEEELIQRQSKKGNRKSERQDIVDW